jgi:hypothetical protein
LVILNLSLLPPGVATAEVGTGVLPPGVEGIPADATVLAEKLSFNLGLVAGASMIAL